MFSIKLVDGSIRSFSSPVTCFEIASDISTSLSKKAIAAKVNDDLKDLSYTPNEGDVIKIITTDTPEGLEIIRHDAAHILAQAVKELYGNDVQVTIGPTIENGFYYDFVYDRGFTTDDFSKIEAKMREIVKRNEKIVRRVVSKDEAIEFFEKLGEQYKVEIIRDLPDDVEISIYDQGNFADLCRGPHGPSTGFVKAFKLTKVSGAYWRGDSKNKMLQRIYGTAWATQEQLDNYLKMLEEAEKRDHRRIGKEMDLFHFQEDAPGAVFWHPKGWILFQALVEYMRGQQKKAGYLEINTPEVMDRSLWETSGHWEKFSHNMFTATAGDDDRIYAVKPMNCPGCVQVFKHGLVSYKDLPMRLSEFGKVHRYESSGALYGLLRVRAFTQDDAHIFCTEDQMLDECLKSSKLLLNIYKDFGFNNIKLKFSDRPEKRIGSDEVWDRSEAALLNAIKALDVDYTINSGEGAFYGPKIEFVLKDAIGRDWQMGTLQMDFNLPQRLGAFYVAEDGSKRHPVMLHRAVLGSLERFIGILLEHYAGNLPLWLAPVQLCLLSITNEVSDFVIELAADMNRHGIRTVVDIHNETLNYKIRKHSLEKIPVIGIIGRKEVEENSISFRRLGSEVQEVMRIDTFLNYLLNEIKDLR